MTKIHDSKDMVSEQDLVNVEKQLSIKLPDSYRDFLKKYNGGYPQPDGFDFANGEDGSSVDKFLEISDSKNESLIEYFNKYKNRIPKNYAPIAKDPGGNLILIGVNGENAEIYFWDHENEVDDGDIPGMDNMNLIALNFDEFINNLYEIEI
ncbi:SMI1 / KNR4 family (SUKH-1) [Candidatus Pantoea varia]|uniref:SMI1 / KNR4 family (SUKH-1) n=1 Tax=Candidatus Pantoea varia TaxID=1881036 RepID=A0A1I4YYN6_9GAMM|nr:SMI1/KNR4 family protein [Pantoea varia]SFN43125.1 SMI1 / KNR4 family (SUKH-1) [Pantoea varia]